MLLALNLRYKYGAYVRNLKLTIYSFTDAGYPSVCSSSES